MGNEKYMVTTRRKDERFPLAFFFEDIDVAVRYYNDLSELYKHEAFYARESKLWKLEAEPEIVWKLIRTT